MMKKNYGERILQCIIELLSVKSIITFMILGAITYIFIYQVKLDTPIIDNSVYVGFGSSILTYFFTRKLNKNEQELQNKREDE